MRNFRNALRRAVADAEMTPTLRLRVYAYTIEGGKRKVKRKLSVALVAALVLLLVASIAYATGIGKTIFSEMIEALHGRNGEKFEVADELSSNVETRYELTVAPGMAVTFKQSYYDGVQLLIGYALEGTPPAVDFDFDPSAYVDLSEITSPYNAQDITMQLSGEDAATLRANLDRDGHAGALIPRVYVTDGKVDGEHLWASEGTEVEDGTGFYYPSLPDVALDKDSLTIVFEVGLQYDYIYVDGKDSYLVTLSEMYKIESVALVVPRTADAMRTYAGTYSDDRYVAKATVYSTPLSIRSTVCADVPADWLRGWKEAGKLAENGYDVPVGYVLVVDGVVCEGTEEQNSQSTYDCTRSWEYEYFLEIPDGANLSLRPVYSISGEVAAEDIPLTLQ